MSLKHIWEGIKMNNILEISDLIVDYGIIRALKGVNLNVAEGSLVALLGANGAGKSTLIRTISGIVKSKSGKILYKGKDLSKVRSYKITSLGIIQSPEGRMILRGLSVEENLMVGAYSVKAEKVTVIDKNGNQTQKRVSAKTLISQTLEEVFAYFPVLKERRKQPASTLSGGEQQMLAIGRALMGRPKVLLLDEPSLGLAPLIVQDIFRILKTIKERGTTILIVEQNAYQTLKIADYVYVLELGKIKTQGTASELMKDDALVKAYLGENR